MKIESVVKINIEGKYEVLYMGADRGVARNVFKKALPNKEEYQALFHQSGYSSRSMSKIGHQTHKFNKESKAVVEAPKKRRRKKDSEG